MTAAHVEDLLPEYAAGTLAVDLAARVETHLPGCERCARELAVIDDVYAALALALPPVPPSTALRDRVLADVTRVGRFDAVCARVAAMLDLAKDKARDLLRTIDQATSWVPGPAGVELIHLPAGPAVAGANCGFVRLPASAKFPHHRHRGEERVLVVQGGYQDSDGRIYRRGDDDQKPAGSEHSFTALPGTDLIYLVVLYEGIDIPSMPDAEL